MAFPNVDWTSVKADVKAAWDAQGSPIDFTLRGGATFTIKGTQGHRGNDPLTAGMGQDAVKIRVLYDDWHNAAGASRRPEKGDRLSMWGRNHSVEVAHHRGADAVGLVYVLICRG
jgi:hypothetical protein